MTLVLIVECVGILDALRLNRAVAGGAGDAIPLPQIASPFSGSPSHLHSLPWHDLLGEEFRPITRGVAMSVPAVARARQLICSSIARCPLTVWRGDEQLAGEAEPTWVHRTASGVSPFHRMLWTIDDLFFFGWSLWSVDRGSEGQVLDVARIPYEWWDVNEDGAISITYPNAEQTYYPNADEVVLIPGPHEGILAFGSTAIRHASALNAAAQRAAEVPTANVELHYTGDRQLTDPEIEALLSWWVKARQGLNGGVAFTNKWTEVKEHGAPKEQLLLEGRNYAAVDVARIAGIPASMIDATTATASLTYETTEGRNGEFIDYGLAQYMSAVASRLSADDVVPRGQSARFDTTELRDLAPLSTGPVTED